MSGSSSAPTGNGGGGGDGGGGAPAKAGGSGLTAGTDALRMACLQCLEVTKRPNNHLFIFSSGFPFYIEGPRLTLDTGKYTWQVLRLHAYAFFLFRDAGMFRNWALSSNAPWKASWCKYKTEGDRAPGMERDMDSRIGL